VTAPLGVPRNPDIPANKYPHYFDLGLCGPLRTDFLDRNDYCGLFRTPTFRNVALQKGFFHNGVCHSLRQAVEFYVERETKPGQWYPRSPNGVVDKYNDLPQDAKANVNMDPPFDRKTGERPALSSTEIDDVVAFFGGCSHRRQRFHAQAAFAVAFAMRANSAQIDRK
jgi:cytochrome c peroxidase